MKKIMMLFLVLIILLTIKDVFAQDQYKLTLEKQSGVYFLRKTANSPDDSQQFYVYIMDGIYAYCIEPGVRITTYTYVESEDDLGFSDEIKEKLELIGYYGRDYPGHDNARYSMAAQALIWELTGVDSVTYWTKLNGQGEEIDVTRERKEIMELVNNHKVLPSFNTHYEGELKHEMIIKDDNGVLDEYYVYEGGLGEVYIENNSLRIIPHNVGTAIINLVRKTNKEYRTIFFVGKSDSSSQKVARLNFTKEISMTIYFKIEGIHLLIHKLDENNNPIKLPGIKFKIRDLTRGVDICSGLPDCIHRTDLDGIILTEALEYGEYEIEEMEDQIIPGYALNKEKLHIVINEDTEIIYDSDYYNIINVNFNNHSVSGSLEINKKGEEAIYKDNTISYEEIKLSNIEFELYSNNNLITTITTNNDGYAKIDNLSLGKYSLVEKTKLDNYIEKDKIDFEIKQDNQYQTNFTVTLDIKNILKKGNLEFSKEDLVTSEGIPNTIIEIYDDKDELLFTKETDEHGKVIINDLPIGKYYIIEKEANSLYMITNEKVLFEIKEDGEIVKAKMTNEKIEIPVFKTNTKEDIIAHSIFGIGFLIGIGRMYYERKYSY